jgi:hypothetical protein
MTKTLRYLVLSLALLVPSLATAQTYSGTSLIKWDSSSNAMDAQDAQTFTYKAYVNGSSVGVVVNNVTCGPPIAPDVVFSCQAPVPASLVQALNRRRSAIYISAEDTVTPVSGESLISNTFTTNRKPNQPEKLRLQ